MKVDTRPVMEDVLNTLELVASQKYWNNQTIEGRVCRECRVYLDNRITEPIYDIVNDTIREEHARKK